MLCHRRVSILGNDGALPSTSRLGTTSILEKSYQRGKILQAFDYEISRWMQRLRVFHAGFETEQPRPGRLQVDITAGAQLRLMAFHQFHPARKMFADIDPEGAPIVGRFGAGRDRIFQVMLDRVGREIAQFPQPAVAREARRVAAKMTNDDVIGMLLRRSDGTEQNVWARGSDLPRDRNVIDRRNLQMTIATQTRET